MDISSDFALLDVKKGRKKLFKYLGFTPDGPLPNEEKRIPITITGFIVGAYGDDDGVSREFQVEVTGLAVTE